MFRNMLVGALLCASILPAYGGTKPHRIDNLRLPIEIPGGNPHRFMPPAPDFSPLSLLGTPTTLTGFWDYQTNGGASQYIRVDASTGAIHVVMMVSDDSANQNDARRTAYAYSTDDGVTWNNFSQLRVPDRRSGYPYLDLGQGSIAGAAIIANHSIITGGVLQSTAFVDFPAGGGAFAEVSPPSVIAGTDEPVWPAVAGTANGSTVMAPSRQTAGTTHIDMTADYVTWVPWVNFPGVNSSAQNVVMSNGTGRVGVLENAGASGVFWLESTDNGASWPSSSFMVHPPLRGVGSDSFQAYVSSDVAYQGNAPLMAIQEANTITVEDGAQIAFWSEATGYVTAVPHDAGRFIQFMNKTQLRHITVGYPAIALSGTTIVIVFQAFQSDTSATGYNYSDIWWTKSTDGGLSWQPALNITNTPTVDERYPSISKWNPPGRVYIVWQEDTEPGANIPTVIEGPLTRASQKFLKLNITTGVAEDKGLPGSFALGPNFPNPFNPSTRINYTVVKGGPVAIRVYDVLGREVAVLVNDNIRPGSYQAVFNGDGLASGIYVYRMTANGFTQTQKMILMK